MTPLRGLPRLLSGCASGKLCVMHFCTVICMLHRLGLIKSGFILDCQYVCTVLWFFLLSDPAEFSVAFFQYFMHYYQDGMTRQHFTCHGHYYGRVWNWLVEKLVHLNHACWCLSVVWIAIPETMVRTVSCSSNQMNQPQSPKRKNFWRHALRKNGFPQKIRKNKKILPILDVVAKILLIISSKHPTQKLGFRESFRIYAVFLCCLERHIVQYS